MDTRIISVKTNTLSNEALKYLYSEINSQFDKSELRKESSQMKAFNHDNYMISYIAGMGFALWWDFKDFVFIEYLLVKSSKRNQGIGSLLLDDIKSRHKLIVLEVDYSHGLDAFYYQNGFLPCNLKYNPVQINDTLPKNLSLMSYDHILSTQEFDAFVKKISSDKLQF